MNRYLVFWILNGTMNMGTEVVNTKGLMNVAQFEDLQKHFRKKHGKNLCIQAFSKFEGRDMPIINVSKT